MPSTTLVKQWMHIYEIGKSQNPAIAAVAASASVHLAIVARRAPYSRELALRYGSAAAMTLGTVPFTSIFMAAANNRLMELADSVLTTTTSSPYDNEIDLLLARWRVWSALRGALSILGGILGLVSSLPFSYIEIREERG